MATYSRYGRNNVLVSRRWLTILRAADRRRIPFVVTSGHRTKAEQEELIREKGCWSQFNRDGAACPWWASKHTQDIPNHALDVSRSSDGENKLQRWLNSHRGVRAVNDVPGEPWHLSINRAGQWLLYLRYRRR
jgi:hypothetical protein